MNFSTIGFFIFFLYPMFLFAITIYVSISKEMTLENYFFGGKNVGWFPLSISFFASVFISPYLFSFTYPGIYIEVILTYGIVSILMIISVNKIIIPRLKQMNHKTLPHFFDQRFNPSLKIFVSILYVLTNLFIRLQIILIAGNILLHFWAGMDSYFTLLFLLVLVSINLLIGGMKSEMYTNILHFFILLIVTLVIMIGVFNSGDTINSELIKIYNTSKIIHYSYYPIIEMIFVFPLLGFWFWCVDQAIGQKMLCCHDIKTLRSANYFGIILQLLLISVLILQFLYLQNINYKSVGDDFILKIFQSVQIPQYLKTLFIVGGCSVLIMLIAGVFRSTTATITFDFFQPLNPNSSNRKLVLFGRLTTIMLLIISILLLQITQSMSIDNFINFFNIFIYFSAMISVVYIVGFASVKMNSNSILKGASITLVIILSRVYSDIFLSGEVLKNGILKWIFNSSLWTFLIFISLIESLFIIIFSFLEKTQFIKEISKKLLKKHLCI